MEAVVYDAGALIAADRGVRRMLMAHRELLALGMEAVVPLVVLAQAWRGGAHPELSIVLKGCVLVPEDEALAKAAGIACAAAGTSDVVDAMVVITAVRRAASIVTSDPHDLARIADALRVKLQIDAI